MPRRWYRKEKPVKLLRQSAYCQWETPPVAPFTVQRFSMTLVSELTIIEEFEHLVPAVRRAWNIAYPYQTNMVVQVIDARDSVILAHDSSTNVIEEYGADGAWLGTQAAFDVLKDSADDVALIDYLEQRARTVTRKVCPST